MVKLRLRRKGRTHHPIYDIVAVDSRKRRDGAYIERLGYYDPHQNTKTININHERAIYWLNVGAQPTNVVRLLMSYDGVLLRRALQKQGRNQEEIEAEIAKHHKIVAERYQRRKEIRRKRIEAKKKAEQEAQNQPQETAAE